MGFKIAKKGIYKNYKYVITEVELAPYYHVNGYVKLKEWIGFDTAHYFDNYETKNIDFVENECKYIIEQLIELE